MANSYISSLRAVIWLTIVFHIGYALMINSIYHRDCPNFASRVILWCVAYIVVATLTLLFTYKAK